MTFYPVTAAAAQGLVRRVGHLEAPPMPRKMRRAGARANDGAIQSWVIEEDGTELLRDELSREELQLPIAAIWNHALLVERISRAGDPLADRKTPSDNDALAEASKVSDSLTTCTPPMSRPLERLLTICSCAASRSSNARPAVQLPFTELLQRIVVAVERAASAAQVSVRAA